MAKATKQLVLAEPFYGLFLMGMGKEWTNRLSTAGVGKNGINVGLGINPLFWESLTPLWQQMILKHCCLNVVFHHLELGDDLQDKEIMSIASSIVCNQYIDPSWLPLFDVKYKDYKALNEELYELLKEDIRTGKKTEEEVLEELRKHPPRSVYIQDFPELKLEEKKGLKYYYDILVKAKDKPPGKGGSQALNDLLQNRQDGIDEGWMKDWSQFQGMSEAEKKLLKSQIDYQLKEIADQVTKSRGTVPGELVEYIKNLDKKDPPKFNWRAYLRRFVGGSEKVDILRSRAKYNIRFPENPGRRIRSRAHLIVGVDTSGSMSSLELKEAFHEIYHVQKTGNDVTIIQFDSQIHNVKKYKKGLEDSIAVTGRAGTCFDDVTDYINEHKNKASCAIIFTDGEAPPPNNKPLIPTLWVHTSKSSINEGLPGLKIKLEL